MSPKLGKNQSPILVKILMIQKNSPQKNHQNWWHFLVKKMSLNLEQNYSQNKVKILVIQQIFLQKCHRDWWKSDGITKICANFVENQGGLIYGIACAHAILMIKMTTMTITKKVSRMWPLGSRLARVPMQCEITNNYSRADLMCKMWCKCAIVHTN